MFCKVFWMQKLRGSAFLPVVPVSSWAQLEKPAARQAAHAFDLVAADLSAPARGVTKTRVELGVRNASVKPWAIQPSARARVSAA